MCFVIYVMHVLYEMVNFSWQSLFQCRAFWVMLCVSVAKLQTFTRKLLLHLVSKWSKTSWWFVLWLSFVWKTGGSTLNLSVQVLGYAINAVTLWCIHFEFVYYAKKERRKEQQLIMTACCPNQFHGI